MQYIEAAVAALTRRGPRNRNPNERLPDESYQDYRERLREQQDSARGRLGRVLWPAYKGTYVRAKHGPLG